MTLLSATTHDRLVRKGSSYKGALSVNFSSITIEHAHNFCRTDNANFADLFGSIAMTTLLTTDNAPLERSVASVNTLEIRADAPAMRFITPSDIL